MLLLGAHKPVHSALGEKEHMFELAGSKGMTVKRQGRARAFIESNLSGSDRLR